MNASLNSEDFKWCKIVDSQGECIGIQRIYIGNGVDRLMRSGHLPFYEAYFIEPDERGKPVEITHAEFETLCEFHRDSPRYQW